MKKSFMFVAVAAAGMLASCSSESLTGSDPKIEPTQEDRVPIEIGVATAQTKAITRGVGTVGGAVIGAVFMGVLNNGMSILGIDANIQKTVKGLVLLLAVVVDVMSKKRVSN